MSRLMEIATELSKNYRREKELELASWRQEQDLTARKTALVPEGGWPGKNEAERNASRDKALATDEVLVKIGTQMTTIRVEHTEVSIRILELEAERRALEWEIRDRLAQRVAGHTDETNGGTAEVTGTDVVLDGEVQPAYQEEIPF